MDERVSDAPTVASQSGRSMHLAQDRALADELDLSEEGEANPEILYAVGWTDGTADPVISTGAFVPPGISPNWTLEG